MKNQKKQQLGKIAIKWFLMCAMLLLITNTEAFGQDVQEAKTAMQKLSKWVGNWEGEGWQMDPSGQRNTFKVTENVVSKLSGLAIQVEGRGQGADGYLGHNAIGLIYYDLEKKIYQFNSVTQEGYSSISELNINSNGEFVWGYDVPSGQVRFTIQITEDSWIEKGTFGDGNNWYPFLEMRLTKKK